MTLLALAVALLALAGVVVLAFGYSALLRVIDELQRAVAAGGGPTARPVPAFAGGRTSVVLVVDGGCRSCEDRLVELADHVASGATGTLEVHVLGVFDDTGLPESVRRHGDAGLTGSLAVTTRPSGLVFDTDGRELRRSVLGDATSWLALITWALEQDARHDTTLTGRSSG